MGLAMAAGTAALAGSSYRMAQARASSDRVRAELVEAKRQVEELVQLRGQRERVATKARPEQDVIALVNAVLAEADLPSDRLKNLAPESNEHLTPSGTVGGRYRRQSVSLNLEALSPDQIGKFLDQLRRQESLWTATRLELNHVRNQPDPAELYNLRVSMSATYLADDLPGRPK